MLWIFGLVGLVATVVIGLVVLGRETARLSSAPRAAVYDMAQAVEFIADRLPGSTQARMSHDDVAWVLASDADLLEGADVGDEDHEIDQDEAVARILELADSSGRELADEDVAAVLEGRMDYLRAIGAIGPRADVP